MVRAQSMRTESELAMLSAGQSYNQRRQLPAWRNDLQVMSDALVCTTSNGNPWEVGEGNGRGQCSFLQLCDVVLGTEHGAFA